MHDQSKTNQEMIAKNSFLKQRIQDREKSDSDRKPSEEHLDTLMERLHLATRVAHMGVWDWDIRKNVLVWDDQMYALYGVRKEDFSRAYEAWLNVLHPDDREASDEISRQALQGAREYDTEFRIILPDGGIRIVKAIADIIRDREGNPVRMIGVNYDITARKQVEEALERRTHDLGERVKELNCVYGLSDLAGTSGDSIEVLLQGAAELLPPAMQYPSIACSRITLDRHPFSTANFAQTPWRLQCSISLRGVQAGSVEVCYLEARPDCDDGPFLRQEGQLLEAVAERLGKAVERIQTRQALQVSEENFRNLFQNASIGIFHSLPEGKFLRVNPALSQMLGYASPEEMISTVTNIGTQIYVDSKNRSDLLAATMEKAGWVYAENRYRRKDGTILTANLSVRKVNNSDGTVAYLEGFVEDITDRKQTEEALQENEKISRTLIENAAVGIAQVEAGTGRFLAVNPMLCQMVGRTEKEMLATTFMAITHPDDANLHQSLSKRMYDGEIDHYNLEKRYLGKDKGVIWANITVSRLWKPGETPGRIITIVHDITERKQAEEALQESEGKYRTIIEGLEDGYNEVDIKGNFTFFNEPVCKILGYERDELLKMNNRQYADEENARKIFQAYNRVYLTGKPVKNFEWQVIRKDGARRDVEVSISIIRNGEGHPTGFRGIVRDITDRKRAEQERKSLEERLQRAEKMEALGQLAGGVAHDLNNVLGILSGYSELLLEEIPEGHRSRGHAEKILQSTEKGAAIIQDLLTLARRGVTASDVINLNSVVSGFLKTPVFEKMKDYHPRVTFRTECDKNVLNIKGSPIHLEKTLINLVSNAAESISGKGEVTIRTESRYLDKAVRGYDEVKEGDYAVLTVSDTGTGIPAENREKIFEPFYTKKTMGRSGTGLGLSIVWGTVKDHHGYIDVQTEVGTGTTFTLYFPVTREELIAPQQKEPIERYMGNGESVLVVDDIAEQRDVAARLLTRLGYDGSRGFRRGRGGGIPPGTYGGHSGPGHDYDAGDRWSGDLPKGSGNQPEAEGHPCQRFFRDGKSHEGSETGSRRLCQEALCDGTDRCGHPG